MSTVKCELSPGELVTQLEVAFPGIWHRPIREFGTSDWIPKVNGLWISGHDDQRHDIEMPDGLPLSCSIPDPDFYDGFIHLTFINWLEARGWWYECYDYGTYFLLPDSCHPKDAAPELAQVGSRAGCDVDWFTGPATVASRVDDDDGMSLASVSAKFVANGFALHCLDDGALLMSRWGLTRVFADARAAVRFLSSLGVK